MNTRTVAVDSAVLRQRLQRASLRLAQLSGVREADLARRATREAEVAAAKGRSSLHEEVSRVFEALQQRAHERSVGAFERLLTAILNDVLPSEGKVRLVPQFKNNSTWLDILLEKDGNLEDVIDGNGGAVANVLSSGLRFASLSRTANRRLMILDEPDCWLKPERVPAFFRVVSQVAQSAKTQTFFISHHSPDKFEGLTNIVEFHLNESGDVAARVIQPVASTWEDDATPGVRAIELVNVRRHKHTVIPCFPGATAFIGDNNLGKSTALISAFRAVGYGESDDALIRHGQDECRIVIHLEHRRRIEMTRQRGRSPAVQYTMFEGDSTEPVQGPARQPARNQAPGWVVEALGVSRVDELDIQLGNQKSPVFLLDDTAPRRAQILSVGKEAGHLRSFMKVYDDVRAADRETIRQGEAEVSRLSFRLRYLEAVPALGAALAERTGQSEALLASIESQEALTRLTTRLAQLEANCAALTAECAALASLPSETPTLHDTKSLEAVCTRLARQPRTQMELPALPELPALSDTRPLEQLCARLARAPLAALELPALPEVPQLHDNSGILALGTRLGGMLKRQALQQLLPALPAEAPEIRDTAPLAGMLSRLDGLTTAANTVEAEHRIVSRQLMQQEAAWAAMVESVGGECPLCGAHMSEEEESAHAH